MPGLFEEKIKRDPKEGTWHFPGGPGVKASLSNAVGSIPGQGTKISRASWPKNRTENRNTIVTNSVKTLEMVHIKKTNKKKF